MKQRYLLIFIFLVSWFALIGQAYLILAGNPAPAAISLRNFFTYFTIQSNILVAVCVSILLFSWDGKAGSFFSSLSTRTAIAVYITVVGLVYNILLRFQWAPTGWQRLVDELLHVVVPVCYVIYWAGLVKSKLGIKDLLLWLIYPLLYATGVLLAGTQTGFYPYPFLNVTELGYSTVLINAGFVTGVFVLVGAIFLMTSKRR